MPGVAPFCSMLHAPTLVGLLRRLLPRRPCPSSSILLELAHELLTGSVPGCLLLVLVKGTSSSTPPHSRSIRCGGVEVPDLTSFAQRSCMHVTELLQRRHRETCSQNTVSCSLDNCTLRRIIIDLPLPVRNDEMRIQNKVTTYACKRGIMTCEKDT